MSFSAARVRWDTLKLPFIVLLFAVFHGGCAVVSTSGQGVVEDEETAELAELFEDSVSLDNCFPNEVYNVSN